MFFGKRRRKKSEDEAPPPLPDELDDDFGFESEHGEGFERFEEPAGKRPGQPGGDETPAAPATPGSRPTAPPRDVSRSNRPLVDPGRAGSGVGRDLHDATFVTAPPTASSDPSTAPVPPALAVPSAGDDLGDDVTRFVSRPVAPTEEIVAWLVAANGPNRGQDYRLDPGGVRVGTAPECHLRLPGDTYVSTHHAELAVEGSVHVLRDLGSTNGTFRNGERVTETPLEDDDRVRFGLSDFVFKVARL